MNIQDKYKDNMTPEPVKVETSSFGNLDRFFCHIKIVFIAKNSRENKYIYKTCGLKTGSIKVFRCDLAPPG